MRHTRQTRRTNGPERTVVKNGQRGAGREQSAARDTLAGGHGTRGRRAVQKPSRRVAGCRRAPGAEAACGLGRGRARGRGRGRGQG